MTLLFSKTHYHLFVHSIYKLVFEQWPLQNQLCVDVVGQKVGNVGDLCQVVPVVSIKDLGPNHLQIVL